MKEFTVTDGKQDFAFRLPTKISEITSDYLKAVTDDIVIAPYYAVIASIYRAKLPEVISTNKKSKAMAVAIVPVFVKANLNGTIEDGIIEMFNQLDAADRIIIAGTDIERGYQLSTPKNMITMENVIKIYNHDNNFAKEVMIDQNYYFFVDFKMVPITDIKGKYNMSNPADFINPFVTVNSTEAGS
jgi:hypothetical protein